MNDESLAASLSIRVEPQDRGLVVFLAGEYDIASKGLLPAAVNRHQRPDDVTVVIDIAELKFIDSTGLADIASMNADDGRASLVSVRGARPQARRVFEVTGLGHFLDDGRR